MQSNTTTPFLLTALLALALACGSSSDGSGDRLANGGIGGTGYSEGPITDFGSIFVNGIEWFLDDAEIDFDEMGGAEDDLRIGMVVRVEGELDDDGRRGDATRVIFEADLEGPVSSITPVGVDGLVKELRILGQRVWIETGQTRFEDDDDSSFGFDSIAVDDVVEVSGLLDGEGVIRATHVEREGTLTFGSTEVELRGTISGFAGGSTFMLGDVTVTFDPSGASTEFDDLPGGVQNGIFVEVEGVITGVDAVFADEIEAEDEFDDDGIDDYSVTGFVSDFVDVSNFRVAGRQVDATGAEFENGNAEFLRDGVRVEVEGDLVGGVLVADEVEFEDRRIEVSAAIGSSDDVDAANDRFFLLGIPITVTPSTRFDDELGGGALSLDDIEAGDFLEVEGVSSGDGGVVASRVTRDDVDDIELEGPVDSFDAVTGEIVILGVTIATNAGTEFEVDDGDDSRSGFFATVQIGDFVDVEDDEDGDASAIDFADEIELEDEDDEDDD